MAREVVLSEPPKTFVKGLCLKPYSQQHVASLSKALADGDRLPLPKVAHVEGMGLCVLDGNHTLMAMISLGKELKVLYMGELTYSQALEVVIKSNPVGYRAPSQSDFSAFVVDSYRIARARGMQRKEFLEFFSGISGRSERTLYRILGEVFREEDQQLRLSALSLLASGKRKKEVCSVLGIPETTLRRWLRQGDTIRTREAIHIFDGESISQDFLSLAREYIKNEKPPSLDGLFLYLSRNYRVDAAEWQKFSKKALELLPEDIRLALGIVVKQRVFTRPSRKKNAEDPLSLKPAPRRGITSKGIKTSVGELLTYLERSLKTPNCDLRLVLQKTAQKLRNIYERINYSAEKVEDEELIALVKKVIEMINKIHALKTGYTIVNSVNYGAYVRVLKNTCKFLLKRFAGDGDRTMQYCFISAVYNAYGLNQDWVSFLARAVQHTDELRHRFSTGQRVYFKVLKRELDRDQFISLLNEVSDRLQKSMSMSSSSPGGREESAMAMSAAG